MNKKDTILIVYPAGSYGTFLEWCLSYFSGLLDDDSIPFDATTGSSHKFVGNVLDFPNSMSTDQYFSSDLNYRIMRSHGITEPTRRIEDYIEKYKDYVKFLINIVADERSTLLTFHNIAHKIKQEDRADFFKSINSFCELSNNDKIWEQREKISFKIKYFHCHANYFGRKNSNQLTVTVSDIINNLKNCLETLFDKTGLAFDSSRMSNFNLIEQQWLELQEFKHLDQLCRDIAIAAATGSNIDWSGKSLTIYDEAYVQMLLRDLHKLDLKCYNLDEFPTNSHDLRKFLIHV